MTVSVLVRQLGRDRSGLAMIEFALALPVFLALLLYGFEVANLGLATLRVHQIAATAADNAARVRDSISEDDVNEVLLGGKLVGGNMDFAARGRIVLSDVLPNGLVGGGEGQKILWQRCAGALNVPDSQPMYGTEGKGATDSSLQAIGKVGRQIAPSAGSALIFAEVTYRYKPVVSATLLGAPILRSEASFMVRERASETLTRNPGTSPSTCNNYAP